MYIRGEIKPLIRPITCIVEGCKSKSIIRGFCGKHYQRFRKHGDTKYKEENMHGLSQSPEYGIWENIKDRCYRKNNKAYKNYGGRGIIVCKRWLDYFINFYNDMGARPSKKHEIDRINNDGNYEPSNCRWATRTQNLRHTRNVKLTLAIANNIRIEHKNGLSLSKCSEKYKISKTNIRDIVQNNIWRNEDE